VARVCQASPHRAPQTGTAPGIAAQWRAQADGTPVTSAVRHGGRHQLTSPDTFWLPPHAAEWLASKCAPSRRVVGLPPWFAEGGLGRGGDFPRAEALRGARLREPRMRRRLPALRGASTEHPRARRRLLHGWRGLGGAAPWCRAVGRVLGFPYLKRLRASKFGKEPA